MPPKERYMGLQPQKKLQLQASPQTCNNSADC